MLFIILLHQAARATLFFALLKEQSSVGLPTCFSSPVENYVLPSKFVVVDSLLTKELPGLHPGKY